MTLAEGTVRRERAIKRTGHRLRRTLTTYLGVSTVLVAMIIFFTITSSNFATYDNLINILQTNAVLLVICVGVTFTLLVGGFDLSVGGVVVLTGILLGKLIEAGVPVGVAIVILLAGSILFGLGFNGLLIAWLGVNFFVVTLGGAGMLRGLALVVSDGNTIPLYEGQHFLREIGVGTVGTIPVSAIIALTIWFISLLVLRYSGYGRMVYAVGGNPEAARIAGIPVMAVRMSTYAISAGLACVAGVIETGRLASAGPTTDASIELTAAAAVLIGGTSFMGGVGTMLGTLLGVAFVGVLQNGLLNGNISVYWQGVVTGFVLVAAVTLDRLRERREIKAAGGG